MKKFFVLLMVSLLLAACSQAPVPRQIQNSFPINTPFDKVWPAVIETFAELNLPIMNMEKVSGLITTDWITFSNWDNKTGYSDCGELGMAGTETSRRGKFNVFVKTVGDTCEVKINAVFSHIFKLSFSHPPEFVENPCVSTGILEAEIFRLISEKAK